MSLLLTLLVLVPPALGHAEMSWPYPLRSRFDPATPQSLIDYNMKSPLDASGVNFPCKGYQADTPQNMVTTYNAGSTYNFSIDGSATHGGGSCQLSLSYDNGKTFKVIKSMIGGCPLQKSYDFTIPSSAPTGHALFAWTWMNYMGNREFYMNCASVHVMGASSYYKQARDSASPFDALPNIWVANLAAQNQCTTDGPNGNLNAVYPDPGPDVVYGDGMSSSSPPTPGECEVPIARRQAAATGSSYSPGSSNTADFASTSAVVDSVLVSATSTSLSTAVTSAPATSQSNYTSASMSYNGLASLTTVTMTVDCPSTVTVTYASTFTSTVPPGTYTVSAPSSACTGTTALCPCNTGYSCVAIGSCTWACLAMPMTGSSSFQTSVIAASSRSPTPQTSVSSLSESSSFQTSVIAATSRPASNSPPSQPSAQSTPTSAPQTPEEQPGQPGFVDRSNLRAYLPCVPGTFICVDPDTWYTCDQEVGATWSYQYPRMVAAGMQCQPHLSPSGSSSQYGQQGNTPQGYYRDDQYVRAGS